MSLQPGDRLGPYEITAHIGEGGMGTVYRATDVKLGRDVAIKVLPEAVAADADRLARFDREARTLASLNHPNIAVLYGLEGTESSTALVMEFVAGPTLADVIGRGPVPIDDALPIAKQIAEALEAAHELGIVHRDLKPANVKVRPDGTVKVLDFGLAKALESPTAASSTVSLSPTITTPAMTQMGVILGTAAYMAPEQARGKPVDKRADIWAFGVLLFEIITGRKTFDGDDVSLTLAAVMMKEPDWTALPATTPSGLRRLLMRCLKREPKARLRDIGEARLLLEEVIAGTHEERVEPVVLPAPAGWTRAIPWALAAIGLALGGATMLLWAPWQRPQTPPPMRLEASIGVQANLMTDQGPAAIISPDGKMLAFVAQTTDADARLYVRRLEQLVATPLSGTDGARNPFFSPNGQWIGFFAGGKLKKVAVSGGSVVTLCDAPDGRGGSWAEDDTIVFLPVATSRAGRDGGGGLLRVSSAGGRPEPFTTIGEDELTQRWPQILPGGKAVLYTVTNAAGTRSSEGAYANANIVVQTVPKGTPTVVWRGGYFGRYLRSGHLTYIRDGTLFAAPFDVKRLEMTGQPAPVLEGMVFGPGNGVGQMSVSDDGTLVYVPGAGIAVRPAQLEWVDRAGMSSPVANSGNWAMFRLAPDGHRVAAVIPDGARPDIYIYDESRGSLLRLTNDPRQTALAPVWTPDGRRITFGTLAGDRNLYWQRADGVGEPQRLTTSPNVQSPVSWDPTGRFLAFEEQNRQTASDIMILPMEGNEAGWKPGTPMAFLATDANEMDPTFSPDGKWIAFMSNKSGRPEVYVRPYPGPTGEWMISNGPNGARFPTWSRKRNELFYTTFQGELMMVPYTIEGGAFVAGRPQPWSKDRFLTAITVRRFDLHPDGERFLVARAPQQQTATQQDKVVFVFNFFAELARVSSPR
jgi:serine/threonine-protein kinase